MSDRATSPFPSLDGRHTARGRPQPSELVSTQLTDQTAGQSEQHPPVEGRHDKSSRARSRNTQYNRLVDFRLLDYVTVYDDNLMCAICRCPFIDPVILKDCDHCFCKECIDQTWRMTTSATRRNACPTCRVPVAQGLRPCGKVLINILDDLVVQCPHTDDGCDTELKRAEVQDHLNLYCGYAFTECPEDDCMLPVRRKYAHLPCQHSWAACAQCRCETRVADLDSHWRSDCAVRLVACDHCDEEMLYRDLDHHEEVICSYASTRCPGSILGCEFSGEHSLVGTHSKDCAFAKLGPVILKQNKRLDEQETAQKDMAKKLLILEDGFSTIQDIVHGRAESPSLRSSAEIRATVRSARSLLHSLEDIDSWQTERTSSMRASSTSAALRNRGRAPELRELPQTDSLDMSGPIQFEHGDPTLALSPGNQAPYTSPLDHLLAMHENLRDEVSRISTALQEVDGRHSMQNLNENLRTRDEITYLGAQVAGLSRQVQWLTSAQLQRQQTPRMATNSSSDGSAGPSDATGGVEAAVNAVSAATTYIRNATRSTNSTGSGTLSRRGSSAEGRTKL